jgi:hypothetical protein
MSCVLDADTVVNAANKRKTNNIRKNLVLFRVFIPERPQFQKIHGVIHTPMSENHLSDFIYIPKWFFTSRNQIGPTPPFASSRGYLMFDRIRSPEGIFQGCDADENVIVSQIRP